VCRRAVRNSGTVWLRNRSGKQAQTDAMNAEDVEQDA